MAVNTPTLQALLLADEIYIDSETGKHVIAGVFDKIVCVEFPTVYGKIAKAFVSLTNVRQAAVSLKWVDLSNESVLMESPSLQIPEKDPNASVRLVIDIPPVPLPHSGIFAFELHCTKSGARLGALRVVVEKRNSQ